MGSISRRARGVFTAAVGVALLAAPALAAEGPRPVKVVRVERGSGAGIDWAPASLFATQQATVSTRIAAAVDAVPVHEGDRVKRGELLVRLDARELHAQGKAAEVAFQTARLNEQRAKTLLAANAVPQTALDAARAQRAQAEAALQLARSNLQYAELRAPFDGRIQARKVLPGDFVSPGQPLVELQGAALELHAAVSEAQAAHLAPGTQLKFRVGGQEGLAEVSSLTPGSDALAHRRGLIAQVRSSAGPLRPGDFARIAVPASGSAALWIPRRALTERGDLEGVFVVEGGQAQLRWLSLGTEDADQVELDPADLRDADPVEVAGGR